MIRFKGYRPHPPADYRDRGVAAPPSEPQYEGVIFSDGTVVLRWQTEFRSHSVWASFGEFYRVHGHPEYGTRITFLDGGAEQVEKNVTRDQNRYVRVLDHQPRVSGRHFICPACSHAAEATNHSLLTSGVSLAMIHQVGDGETRTDCPGSRQPLVRVNVDVSDAAESWVDCTEQLRDQLAALDVDHWGLETGTNGRHTGRHDGPHMHRLGTHLTEQLLRANLAELDKQNVDGQR